MSSWTDSQTKSSNPPGADADLPPASATPSARQRDQEDQPSPQSSPQPGPQPSSQPGESAPNTAPWSTRDSALLYQVGRWGQGYFSVSPNGNLTVHPNRQSDRSVDLKQLVDQLHLRGIQSPVLIRFTDILKDRLEQIHGAFVKAIDEFNYQGQYRCVYPIKVNQQRHVVQEILAFGRPLGFGIEAGSKPELLAALALVDDDNTPIICNGFKDEKFVEAVILAEKIGKRIIPVVEKFSELKQIVKHAKRHKVRPTIGVRIKLAARGAGRWKRSAGVSSKFGLSAAGVLEALRYLKRQGMADCLKLVHFHLGSQVNNIRSVKNALVELTRYYVELQKMGADLQYLDVGGGLGVDYDGSNTDGESSVNYTLQEYANDVVYHIQEVCDQAKLPHPTIISESGRAMVAYHSVLVFNVLGQSHLGKFDLPETLSERRRKQLPHPVALLFDTYHDLNENNFVEYYHDAQQAQDQTLNLFNLGYCSLRDRSLGEQLFYGICAKVQQIVRSLEEVPLDFAGLEAFLSDTYFGNWSIFQSLPDSWAIDQLFPIMPIHRLNEKPDCRGILADITCDSDGKIDRFIDEKGHKPVLELHSTLESKEEYYLGVFLVGAYQEILGDMHNLLGDTNAVHVRLGEDGQLRIEEVIEGDTVREVLQYVQFSADDLKRAMRRRVEKALRDQKVTLDESRLLLQFYDSGLEGYTYLE